MENKNEVLDIIIAFTKGIKENGDDRIQCNINNKEYILWSPRYLLNQTLRQYQISDKHKLISKKAYEVWNSISCQNILDYYYQKEVVCENDNPIEVGFFRGNENSCILKKLKKGDKFKYRQVFHDEHIIPIKVLIDELIELNNNNNLNYDTVEEVLDKIYVCKMLKSEDRQLNNKYNRPNDLEKIINELYNKAKIEIYR